MVGGQGQDVPRSCWKLHEPPAAAAGRSAPFDERPYEPSNRPSLPTITKYDDAALGVKLAVPVVPTPQARYVHLTPAERSVVRSPA